MEPPAAAVAARHNWIASRTDRPTTESKNETQRKQKLNIWCTAVVFHRRWLRDTHICKDQLDGLCVFVRSFLRFFFLFIFVQRKRDIYLSRHGNIRVSVRFFLSSRRPLLHLIQYSSTQSLEISLNTFRAQSHEQDSGDYQTGDYYYY